MLEDFISEGRVLLATLSDGITSLGRTTHPPGGFTPVIPWVRVPILSEATTLGYLLGWDQALLDRGRVSSMFQYGLHWL